MSTIALLNAQDVGCFSMLGPTHALKDEQLCSETTEKKLFLAYVGRKHLLAPLLWVFIVPM